MIFRKFNYVECVSNIQVLNHLGQIVGGVKMITDCLYETI